MICPILYHGWMSTKPDYTTSEAGNCKEDQCAWWDDIHEECVVMSIQAELEAIEENLRNLPMEDE